jgi:hypothetical protein
VCKSIGAPSIVRFIHRAVAFARMCRVAYDLSLKLKNRFPDECLKCNFNSE